MDSDNIEWTLISKNDGSTKILPRGMIFVGREECDIQLLSSTIDKRHAVIFYNISDHGFHIKDLNSSTGTFVNKSNGWVKIPEQSYIKLNHLDKIRFGFTADIFYVFRNEKLEKENPIQEKTSSTSTNDCGPKIDVLYDNSSKSLVPGPTPSSSSTNNNNSNSSISTLDSLDVYSFTEILPAKNTSKNNNHKNKERAQSSKMSSFSEPEDSRKEKLSRSNSTPPQQTAMAFTIAFDENPTKNKLNIRDSLRKFAPPKPSSIEKIRTPKKSKEKMINIENTQQNFKPLKRNMAEPENYLSDSATYLIQKMLYSEPTPTNSEENDSDDYEKDQDTKKLQDDYPSTGEKDSGVCDDKSESGTYTVDCDDPAVEEARKNINQVFGVQTKIKADSTKMAIQITETTEKPKLPRLVKSQSRDRSISPLNLNIKSDNQFYENQRNNKDTFSRAKKHIPINQKNFPQLEINFKTNIIQTSQVSKSKPKPKISSISNSANFISDSRKAEINSPKPPPRRASPQNTNKIHAKKSIPIYKFKKPLISPDRYSDGDLSNCETSSTKSDENSRVPEKNYSSDRKETSSAPSMRFNRAFALRRARLGIETPGIPTNARSITPDICSSDGKRNIINKISQEFNRGDGGRFSLRLPRSASTSKKPPLSNYNGKLSSKEDISKPRLQRKSSDSYSSQFSSRSSSRSNLSDASYGPYHPQLSSAFSQNNNLHRSASFSNTNGTEIKNPPRPNSALRVMSPFQMGKRLFYSKNQKTQQTNPHPSNNQESVPITDNIMSLSFNASHDQKQISQKVVPSGKQSTRALSALDSLVISAINQLSQKIRHNLGIILEKERNKLPTGSEARLYIEEVIPQIVLAEKKLNDSDSNAGRDLSNILKNLKKIEKSIEGFKIRPLLALKPDQIIISIRKEEYGDILYRMGLMDGRDGSEDDDLTNLTWLQDCNLLRNMNATDTVQDVVRILNEDNENVFPANIGSPNKEIHSSLNRSSMPCSVPPVPYNPQIHVHAKPPYSFSSLIFMAIESSSNKALPVKDIYAWIVDHFPYYQTAPAGWKNTVRHNLSLNKCFRKVDKAKDDLLPLVGKGSLWRIDPELRPNLLNAVRRTPAHIYPYMSSTKTANISVDICDQLTNSNKLPKKALGMEQIQSTVNIPQSNLFPFLSKRLLIPLSKVSKVESKEADAAESMLTLTQSNLTNSNVLVIENKRDEEILPDSYVDDLDAPVVTITVSPSNDHNYYIRTTSPPTSNDPSIMISTECVSEDSEEEDEEDVVTVSKQHKSRSSLEDNSLDDDEGVKGAEALLNLASRNKRSVTSENLISKRIKLPLNIS